MNFGIRNTVHGILNTACYTALILLLASCSSSDKNESRSIEEYKPTYQPGGIVGAIASGIAVMMFSSPQAGSAKEKDQITGKCKIIGKVEKEQKIAPELCNGVEVFLYKPDGRILQRTWAFDGVYRFKVATEGPYTVKARHAQLNMEAQWEGVRRGQQLNLELIKK